MPMVALGAAGFEVSVPLWVTLGLGDYAVKLALALSMLIPFRVLMQLTRPQRV